MRTLSGLLYSTTIVALCLSTFVVLNANADSRQSPAVRQAKAEDGVIRVKSAYDMDETIFRLKADIAAKGIKFFDQIDQSRLGAEAADHLCNKVKLARRGLHDRGDSLCLGILQRACFLLFAHL